MDYKEQFRKRVEEIKSMLTRPDGKALRNEDIAQRMGYERTSFSALMGKRANVTADHLRALEREFAEDIRRVEGMEELREEVIEEDPVTRLERIIAGQQELISNLQASLDTLLRRQQVIAAMQDAGLEALLFDMADRKKVERSEVRRAVRNRAFSKLDQFEIKGIEVETYS